MIFEALSCVILNCVFAKVKSVSFYFLRLILLVSFYLLRCKYQPFRFRLGEKIVLRIIIDGLNFVNRIGNIGHNDAPLTTRF